MNELSERRLAWQPDIYQRYTFLATLTAILSSEGAGALTLLDVGSGPSTLTEAFVSPRFEIVRADTGRFDDASIVQLQPGEPLPFEDAAFDVAVALEVLEHVPPAQRPDLIRELQRVSRQATIVCCPVDAPEVVDAELQFSAYAKVVTGRDVDFLVEHREYGLPAAANVVSWFNDPAAVLVADNAPLDEWLAFNSIDFIYACDLGDDEAKRSFAAAVNTRAPLARTGSAHYRRFFCAFTSPAHAATASRVIDAAKASDPIEPQRLVREIVTGILGWRHELRERSTREIEALHRHIGELAAALGGVNDASAEKDRQLAEKDRHLAATIQGLHEAQEAIGEKDRHLATTMHSLHDVQEAILQKDLRLLELEADVNIAAEALATARAEVVVNVERLEETQRQAEVLRVDIAAARDQLRQRTSALSAAHARLEEGTQRAAALERELQVMLTSRSWRLTAPLRRLGRVLRQRAFTSTVGGIAGMRRWVRERATRRRNYPLIVESGLFDAMWYRERYPDVVGAGVDPLVHYLKWGAREGRDPHPLFDTSFYLQSNQDVHASGVNPLVHYLLAGGFEGRAPHPDFDGAFYLASNPDVAAAGLNPLSHYVKSGRAEGRAAFAAAPPTDEYEVHRLRAFARRRGQYPLRQEPGLFSLLTTVWNTPPRYLDALADCVLGQDADSTFEWVLLDNGSHDPGTRASIERLAKERPIRVFRVEDNLGIIGGMRYCLERATHRYVLPVDSDDLLTTDCLRVVSHAVRQAGYPAVAYTDEDKLDGAHFTQSYFKPGFDPVLFANSCYTAHLGVIDRALALELGVYTDRRAEGSHDWDTFTRFVAAGHTPLHIPEVLYSWRIHETSTSGGSVQSKPFVYDSQRCVLTKWLDTLAPSGRFRVELPPRFDGMPDWWMKRDASDPCPVTTVVLASSRGRAPRLEVPKEIPHEVVHLDPADGVVGLARIAARAAGNGRLLHVLWHDTQIVDEVWALEAMGLFELFPDTAMVGGRLHQDGRIVDAGAYFGFGRGCDTPDRGRPLEDPGYHAQAWKPHSVSAVALDHCVLDAHFASHALDTLVPLGVPLDQLGAWLGAAARREERRVIYTPFLSAVPAVDRRGDIAAVARRAFVTTHGDLMPDALLWPPHAGLTHGRPFRSFGPDAAPAVPGEPDETLSYDQLLEADRLARDLPESQAARDVSFTVITGVYVRSPVAPFDAAIRSVLAQTHQRFEWIVLRDGPVSRDVQALLDELARDPRVRVIERETCRGIQHGFRTCLEAATCDWIVPIDADDVLEADALAVMASTIASTPADFVFSDEDHLVDGQLRSRYARPGFDPVLNIESSYIWHLSAFRRERALALDAYTNPGAELCHDWDTSTRFAQAGAAMVHVPHVLYHWRSHEASSSHGATQNPGTIVSTRAVLEHIVAGQSSPAHYEIVEYPIHRGAVELWIRRRPIGDPSFGVVVLRADEPSRAAAAGCDSLARARTVVATRGRMETLDDWRTLAEVLPRDVEYVVVLEAQWRPEGDAWLWEAIKWFELQPDTAIVGGRLLDDDGIVVDAGLGRRGYQVLPLYRGLRRTDPDEFAFALKAQTAYAPAEGFFVVERRFLEAAIEVVTREGFKRPFGATLGALANARHRRAVYSPLLEARRIHIPRDHGSGRDGTLPVAQDVPNHGAAALPSLQLIAPGDWQQVGTRPEFSVRTRAQDARGQVLVFGRDDYFGLGIDRATRVASVHLEPADVAGMLVGMPTAPLPEGDYIAVLKESSGGVLSVSGVCVRDAKERWPRRFQAMLEEQARFTVGKLAAERTRREGEPLFSIATAVHDVDPAFLAALADSILGQRYDDFEWLVLDNGSHRADTQHVSRELAARDPRVRFWRVDDNLHIIGGNRFLLEQARGTYIIPVDHDDVIYPDALRILDNFVAEHHEPDLLYSDEQKITSGGVASEILWRPAWSNLAALSTCPASHLMVFKRTLALEAGLYTSDYARGSPDWDSALRLATRTSRIVQVPFVLYGWRMHPGSTAINEDSKNYLAESQKAVVRHALERLDLAERFDVALACDGVLGYYHAVRHPRHGPRVLLHAVIPLDAARDALTQLRSSLAQTQYDSLSLRLYVPDEDNLSVGLAAAAREIGIGVEKSDVVTYRDEADLLFRMFIADAIDSGEVDVFLNPMLLITNPDWIWEAIGTFELDPSTGIAGGCILGPDRRVHHIGYVSGLDGFFATPGHGQDLRSGHSPMVFIRRNVTAVYGSFMAVKRDVLRTIGGLKGVDRSDGLYGIEFCLRASRYGIKTAYSPRMKATLDGQIANPAGADRALIAQIMAEYPTAGAPDPYYSRHCVPRADAFGSPIVD